MDILVIEDDPHLGESLISGLTAAGFAARLARNVAECRAALKADTFRLALLDLGLPDGQGLDLMAEWREQSVRIPIIITTAQGHLDERLRGLEAGADDYLAKPYAFSELLARIKVQLRHAEKTESVMHMIADLTVNIRTREARRGPVELELTPREFDLLAYLAENQGHLVTRDMLARDVWRIRSRMTSLDNVINVHISRLREKIDGGHSPNLLHTVRGAGFMLRDKA